MKIPTLEGEMTASLNDYIIKGIKGEFYPCKPDIFKQTYEQVVIKNNGIDVIRKERDRQINDEGWDINSDIKKHGGDELAIVAACYALPEHKRLNIQYPETWDTKWWKPTPEDRVKELTKAGALIAAEIDRLLNCKINYSICRKKTFSSCKKRNTHSGYIIILLYRAKKINKPYPSTI